MSNGFNEKSVLDIFSDHKASNRFNRPHDPQTRVLLQEHFPIVSNTPEIREQRKISDFEGDFMMLIRDGRKSMIHSEAQLHTENSFDLRDSDEKMSVIGALMSNRHELHGDFSESLKDSRSDKKDSNFQAKKNLTFRPDPKFELNQTDRSTLREIMRHLEAYESSVDNQGLSSSLQLMLSHCKPIMLDMKRKRRREQKYKKILGHAFKILLKHFYKSHNIERSKYIKKPSFIAELFGDLEDVFKHKFQRTATNSDISITCKFNSSFFEALKNKRLLVEKLINEVQLIKENVDKIFNEDYDRFADEMVRWVSKNGNNLEAASIYLTGRTLQAVINNGRSPSIYNKSKRVGLKLPWTVQEMRTSCDEIIARLHNL